VKSKTRRIENSASGIAQSCFIHSSIDNISIGTPPSTMKLRHKKNSNSDRHYSAAPHARQQETALNGVLSLF
jgi:hypothetical protein